MRAEVADRVNEPRPVFGGPAARQLIGEDPGGTCLLAFVDLAVKRLGVATTYTCIAVGGRHKRPLRGSARIELWPGLCRCDIPGFTWWAAGGLVTGGTGRFCLLSHDSDMRGS